MLQKQEPKTRVKVKKIGIRGDEVAILFFSLVFLAFLLISFFRLFAVGKLFDDFIFTFLFGWSKYLVYLFLFVVILPILFNYYFNFKLSLICSVFLSLFAISWLVANVTLIIKSNTNTNIWLQMNAYSFKDFSDYFQKWWNSTIINDYHGFFGKPISFNDWTDVNSFFPSFAAGGVISNLLIAITNYGTFTTNFVLNLIVLLIAINWLFFSSPWFIFSFFKKDQKNTKKNEKPKAKINPVLNNKVLLNTKEKVAKEVSPEMNISDFVDSFDKGNLFDEDLFNSKANSFSKNSFDEDSFNNQNSFNSSSFDENSFGTNSFNSFDQSSEKPIEWPDAKPKSKEFIIHEFIQESGSLTPFGRIKKDKPVDSKHDEESN